MDLTAAIAGFAAEVGTHGPVTIAGHSTRGGGIDGVRRVRAPAGIGEIRPDEMTVVCGAGTPVDELAAALAEVGQRVALPPGGTVGGALARGHSRIDRLGRGPIRDALLQARFVAADGELVTAGGPTVKNVSGFDLCRLLVGSHGTLGFIAEVTLRTWPLPLASRWVRSDADPWELLAVIGRPVALLWDGTTAWALLEGHPADIDATIARLALVETDGQPSLPTGGRWSLPPTELRALGDRPGAFVAEIGVGIVHHSDPAPLRPIDPAVRQLCGRIKHNFDPTARLNPGLDVLSAFSA